jgi:glyoxylase-like metal-dependent hydrolase (beta-lactamase superfamily II)
MKIKSYCLGQLQTNTYLLFDENSFQTAIIDPADDANFIIEEILYNNLKPKYILATHGHFDHVLASWELQLAFDIPFYVSKKDLFLIKNMTKSAGHWLNTKIVEKPPEKISFLEDIKNLSLGENFIEILYTSGHTPGGVCYFVEKEKIVFTGDTLFNNGIGRTDFKYSRPLEIQKSIKLIKNKFKDFIFFPGHEEFGFTL